MGRVYKPHGRKRWYIDYVTARGGRVRQAVGLDKREARVALRALEERERQRRVGLLPMLDNSAKLADLQGEFLDYVERERSPGTATFYKDALKAIVPKLPGKTVDDPRIADVEQFRAARLKGASPRTVAIEISALKRMLEWAVEREMITDNPIKRVKNGKQTRTKPRRALTTDEVQKLLDTSPEIYRRVWQTFLCTGLRRGELVELRWSDVDLDARTIRVRAETVKTRKGRKMPIPQELAAMLADMKAERDPDAGDPVFVNEAGRPWRCNLLKRLKRCIKAAKINPTGVDLHSMRYTYGTLLYHSGVDIKTLQVLLGHSTIRVTMDIYVREDANVKTKAVERLPFLKNGTFQATVSADSHKVKSA